MSEHSDRVVRQAVGAGRWFSGSPVELRQQVEGFIARAETPSLPGRLVAALAPHAGFVYSGKVAGYTFRAIKENAGTYGAPDTVVVLGFTHRGGFTGLSLMDGDALETPLGEVTLDRETSEFLVQQSPLIKFNYYPHKGEHSAENEVPFVQVALPDTPVVLALLGGHDLETVDALVAGLESLSRRKRILLLASTDMLHDASYEHVTATDEETLKIVATMDHGAIMRSWSAQHQTFCGICGVLTAIRFAADLGCPQATVLHYRNSGDDYPESRGEWVVGYGAVVFAVPDLP